MTGEQLKKYIYKTEIEILGDKRIDLDNQITTLEKEIRTGKGQSEKKAIYTTYKNLK
jgi:hypothetical protein